ncbi:MAG: hypothetical protein ACLFUJ_05770 [Phycisphaerae bacterium]
MDRQVGVSSSHIVLVRIEDGLIVESRVLNEAWTLYNKPEQYSQFLRSVIDASLQAEAS